MTPASEVLGDVWSDIEWTNADIDWIPKPQQAVNIISNYLNDIYSCLREASNFPRWSEDYLIQANELFNEAEECLRNHIERHDLPSKLLDSQLERLKEPFEKHVDYDTMEVTGL